MPKSYKPGNLDIQFITTIDFSDRSCNLDSVITQEGLGFNAVTLSFYETTDPSDVQFWFKKLLGCKDSIKYLCMSEFRAYPDWQSDVAIFVSDFLKDNDKIEYLELFSKEIDKTQLFADNELYSALAEHIKSNHSLHSVSFTDQYLPSKEDFDALETIITEGNIEYLHLNVLGYGSNDTPAVLKECYRVGCKLGELTEVAKSTVKIFDFRGNYFNAERIKSMSKIQQKNDDIKLFTGYVSEGQSLDSAFVYSEDVSLVGGVFSEGQSELFV